MIQAVLAAALFGASTPIAKSLLGEIEPVPLAAFLYLGSGIGLAAFKAVQRIGGRAGSVEAPVGKADLPWLAGAIVAGGVAAPIALMFGLRSTPAATASLLLNFEGVATVMIAGIAFRESVGRRIWLAAAFITGASILLSSGTGNEWGLSFGAVGVLAACILWGVDNNLTRNVSGKDPVSIVAIKGLCAGALSLALAIIQGSRLPDVGTVAKAMAFGSISYGLSIVLFVFALRGLGAARTGAWFGTAPFAGAALSFLVFRERPDALFIAAASGMALGAILLLSEEHAHRHVHAAIEHDHRHVHDDGHHRHEHGPAHSHPHSHEAVEHAHTHTPDIHHRQQH